MENNIDNSSFINDLDPQGHIKRSSNWMWFFGFVAIISTGAAIYIYRTRSPIIPVNETKIEEENEKN